MSLEKKLLELKAKEAAQAIAREEVLQREREELNRQVRDVRENILPSMKLIIIEKVQPLLESVNQVYCDGTGEIKLEEATLRDDVQSVYELKILKSKIHLSWGYWREGTSLEGSMGGKEINVIVSPTECEIICGRDKDKVIKIMNTDQRFLQKLEDAIFLSISSGKCAWRQSWDNYP